MVFVTSSLFRPLIPELRIFSPPESDRYLPRVFPVFPIPKVFHQSRTKPVMAKCVVYDTFVVARKPHVWHPPWKVDKKWKGTRILDPINPYTVHSKYCCIILRGPKIGRLSQMVSLSLSTVNCFENNSIRTNALFLFLFLFFFKLCYGQDNCQVAGAMKQKTCRAITTMKWKRILSIMFVFFCCD